MATANSSRGTRRSGRLSGGNRPRTHPSPIPHRKPPRKQAPFSAPGTGTTQRRAPADARLRARAAKPAGKPRPDPEPPDLDEILGAFAEAHALLAVSAAVVAQSESAGPERVVLRLGVEALNRAYNRLDRAIVDLAQGNKPGRAS